MSSFGNERSVPADQDSLVAMDALLQIGQGSSSESRTVKNSQVSSGRIGPLCPQGGTSCDGMIKDRLNEALRNPLAATINSWLPFKAANMIFNSSSHHAAAVAAAHATKSAAIWTSALGNDGMILKAFVAPCVANLAPSAARERCDGLFPESSTVTSVRENDKTKMSDSESASSLVEIRKEKVEAALRSKPQRGRKRDDLSEFERVELTRTRNREHAKSTR
jgi:hypothetical protein